MTEPRRWAGRFAADLTAATLRVYGRRCHLCGLKRELTFEHIPPQSAFNDHKVLYNDVQTMLQQLRPPVGMHSLLPSELRPLPGKVNLSLTQELFMAGGLLFPY